MFRDLYKKANDDMKGDRAILDKAFLQAAQPEKKKSPVFKYSFVGTVVAAVMLVGAVFANPSVFTNRTEELGVLDNPTEAQSTAALENNEIAVAGVLEADETIEDEAAIGEVIDNKTVLKEQTFKQTTEQTVTVQPKKGGSGGGADVAAAEEAEPDGEDEYAVAVMSLDDEDGGIAYEEATEEAVIGFSLRDRTLTEETVEEATEVTAEDTAVFSYMYDLSCGYDAKTDGFVNVDVSPVTTKTEAIERAKREHNEYTAEYDSVYVYRDAIEDVWKVVFCYDDEVGSEIIVYLNSNGITLMLVNLA